jgi:hypothetical protein
MLNVERMMEGGVEAVVNHLEPYRIKGEPRTFSLEEELAIDTEDLPELGISSIDEMDVDAKGNIYFISSGQVYEFDRNGDFVQTIGRKGQGPGEFQRANGLRITDSCEISFYDSERVKFLFFKVDGSFKEEKKLTYVTYIQWARYLDNGNSLIIERQNEPEKGIRIFHYAILDANSKKIKDLQPSYSIEIPSYKTDRFNLLLFSYSIINEIYEDKIFVSSNMKENLEIEVYNLQGDLLRKIRKESERVKISKEYKEKELERWKRAPAWEEYSLKDKYYFPDCFPSFKAFWVDDEGRILVETYKEGQKPGEHIIHILNPQGIFVGSASLQEAEFRKFKNSRLYCVVRKENDYRKLIVYKVTWEK